MATVARVLTVAPVGFSGRIVEVESDSSKSLPGLQIVGLANKSIDEARERVRSAVSNSLLEFPARRITINLAPAELPKDGTHYDLPIALSILACSGQLKQAEVDGAAFAGELALDGSLRPIRGAIIIAEAARDAGLPYVYLPVANAAQASLVPDIYVVGISSLKELFLHLKQEMLLKPHLMNMTEAEDETAGPLLDHIQGQAIAKRALTIAAAGHHNIIFTGPPGTGKTMIARTLPALLPPLGPDEQIAVTKLHSLAGERVDGVVTRRPFRNPHHTASRTALIGGGTVPRPGDISLAHLGVLFLDELPEYPRSTLEALRQPLEDKTITVSRAGGHARYPADFMLAATMNPCPCGYLGDPARECTCSASQILAYKKRVSGPLLDRIDLTVAVLKVPNDELLRAGVTSGEQHMIAKKAVQRAATVQHNRYGSSGKYNASLSNSDVASYAPLTDDTRGLLTKAADRLALSARGCFKVIKVARTIADLEGAPDISPSHLSEALQYRQAAG